MKQKILQQAISKGIIHSKISAIGFMDFSGLTKAVLELKLAFSDNFVHAYAVKANPLIKVVEYLYQKGMQMEVASAGELDIALFAGVLPEHIVFDSPVKTIQDLETCLEKGVSINLDNLQELKRVDQLILDYPNTKSVIGFRINPQVSIGTIKSTSTATKTSKFGYPLMDESNEEILVNAYLSRPWLNSIHIHTGSQGFTLEAMAKSIAKIVDFAEKVNQQVATQRITHIDIGGGLAVNFASEVVTPLFSDYAAVLKKIVPILFTDKYQVKTEFGRSIAAKSGFIVSRVEYTKTVGGRRIVATHAGANLLTRTTFLPDSWPLRIKGFTPTGQIREISVAPTDVAGPCCFAADLVAINYPLAELQPNDYIVIYDTGAYYFSNHFDYNSLPRIRVYATESEKELINFQCIRAEQDQISLLQSMSPPE